MSIKCILKNIKYIPDEINLMFSWFIIYFPESRLGRFFRERYYRYLLKGKLGLRPRLGQGVFIDTRYQKEVKLEIGDNFIAETNVVIAPSDSFGIIIGNNVSIAPDVYMRAASHNYAALDKHITQQGHIAKKIYTKEGREASIIIEDDVIFGAKSILLSGAKIGKGSVVAAGSVVASEIPEYSVVVGNPARVIANRQKIQFMSGYEVFP